MPNINEIFIPQPVGIFTPTLQIFMVAFLFMVTTLIHYREYQKTGTMAQYYPVRISLLFVPIYEEIIFRGFILFGLYSIYSSMVSIIISSLLFGLWHLKNIFFIPKQKVFYQMAYTALIFGPIMAYITLSIGTIWIAIILHYLNNIFGPRTQKFFSIKS